MDIDLMQVFQPHQAQARVLAATQRYVLFLGGISVGKSTALAQYAVKKALAEPGCKGVVLGRDLKNDAMKVLYPKIRELLGTLYDHTKINFIKKWDGGSHTLTLLNGSQIEFRGYARNPDGLLGHEYAWAAIDELTRAGSTLDPAGFLELVDGRLRGMKGAQKQILICGTAKGLDPISRRFQQAQRDRRTDHYVIKATSFENPFIPRRDIESWQQNMSRRRLKQEVYCILMRPETCVWPEFDMKRHVVDVDIAEARTWNCVFGIDWGSTRGSVGLEFRINPRTYQWVCVDEVIPRGEGVTRQRFRLALLAHWKTYGFPSYAVGDRAIRSEGLFVKKTFATYGQGHERYYSLYSRDEQLRHNGYEMVRDAIDPAVGAPRIVFSSTLERRELGETPGIVPSMAQLSWHTNRAGQPLGFVLDASVYRDATDAARYAWVKLRNKRELHDVLPKLVGIGEVEER